MFEKFKENRIMMTGGGIGLVCVVILGIKIAPLLEKGGLMYLINHQNEILKADFQIVKSTPTAILMCMLIYSCFISYAVYTGKKYRHGREKGSAIWSKAESILNSFSNKKKPFENKLFSQNVKIGFDGKKHHRNLNTVIIGGSGAGKTRTFAIPNILQGTTSFVILDPKGEIIRVTGNYLKNIAGYKIRVVDLKNPQQSFFYNPFYYVENEMDMLRLVEILFKATTPKNAGGADPFWDNSARVLFQALAFYLFFECEKSELTFSNILYMIREAHINENNSNAKSPVDILFDELEEREPDHLAVNFYKQYRGGAAETLKSIQMSVNAKLDKFLSPAVANMTRLDELSLELLGDEKTALFLIVPDEDTSLNFIAAMLYSQIFSTLFRRADDVYNGELPVHTQLIMDEFANVALPNDFQNILSTMRSRNISASIIVQNVVQIKALYEKDHESLIGNCDTQLYLGGNEDGSHKHISEKLGDETIDTNGFSRSFGRNGSTSTNYNKDGRKLMTQDEVAMIDDNDCIFFIRGKRPVYDKKYNLMKHPNIKYTPYIDKDLTYSVKTPIKTADSMFIEKLNYTPNSKKMKIFDLDLQGDIETQIDKLIAKRDAERRTDGSDIKMGVADLV